MNCSYCKKKIIRTLTLPEILGLVSIPTVELCPICHQLFHLIAQNLACPGCGRENGGFLCEDCKQWRQIYPHYLFQNKALYMYDAPFKEWISSYKFSGDYQLRYTFVASIKQALKPYKNYLICPLPLSEERQKTRGFNQVEGVLSAASVSFTSLLQRVDLPAQSGKDKQARMNMAQPYTLAVEKTQIQNQKILLVDDVYTTGRTLFHAAEILLSKQPKRVETLTLAR
ncbi:competence protein ComFC [Enterococcus sp. AZ194]|uniref:ComF family protein n=1 Tax=Enterococcus sp. AZ194 TaxID=2774629 RepID=UPI003F1F1245